MWTGYTGDCSRATCGSDLESVMRDSDFFARGRKQYLDLTEYFIPASEIFLSLHLFLLFVCSVRFKFEKNQRFSFLLGGFCKGIGPTLVLTFILNDVHRVI